MRNFLSAIGGLGVAGLAATGAWAETWDMPTPYPQDNFHTQNIQEFANDVAEATGGELEITLHPANSLYDHAEIKNAVRRGLAPIGEVLVSRLANEDPIFGVDSVPFLATGYDQAMKLYEASKPELEAALEEQGLQLLFSVPWPPQGLYTKEAVDSPDQLEGVKFRAYNTATEQLAAGLGGVPTQVEATDVPTAFSTGRVDAMFTSPSTGADTKAWDYLSHYYDAQAWLPKNMVIVNKAAFDGLPEEQRQAVLDAAATAEQRGWEASEAETEEATQTLSDNGIEVAEPSAELQEAMQGVGEAMTSGWEEAAGETGTKVLEAYRQ